MVEQQLYSIPEAAVYLGLSEKTVWDWVYMRSLASVKVGRLRKIRRSELERIIEENTTPVRKIN
jgi:excisionase family DNA binding protein